MQARKVLMVGLTLPRYEFGGPAGTSAMMVGFPLLMCEYTMLSGKRGTLTV